MAAESTRSRRKDKVIASKLCVYCSKVKPLNDFYGNKGWAAQSFHDAWCKECAVKYCIDKDTLREYCYYNNRRWSEEMYESAVKKAKYSLAAENIMYQVVRLGCRTETVQAFRLGTPAAIHVQTTYLFIMKIQFECFLHCSMDVDAIIF